MSNLNILLNCAIHLNLESKVGVIKKDNKFSLVSERPQKHLQDLAALVQAVFNEAKDKNSELELCASLLAIKKFSGEKFTKFFNPDLCGRINAFIALHNAELETALADPKLESLARYKYFRDFSLTPRRISPGFFARLFGTSHGNANEIKAIEIVSQNIFNHNTRTVKVNGVNKNLTYFEAMTEFLSGSHMVFLEKPVRLENPEDPAHKKTEGLFASIIALFASMFCLKRQEPEPKLPEQPRPGIVEQLQKGTNGWFEGNQESSHYKLLINANRLDHFRIKEGGGIITEMLGCQDSLARVNGNLVLGKAFKVAQQEALKADPKAVVEEVKANELQLEDFKDGPANLMILPKLLKDRGMIDSLVYWLFNTFLHRTADYIPYLHNLKTHNPKPNVAKYGDGGYGDANAVVLE
ncbi:MAG: hypothetical protein HZB76_06740 [Chlamydiae bacterium]|nr:hypothetical protein [Chlamydiota bacterium]